MSEKRAILIFISIIIFVGFALFGSLSHADTADLDQALQMSIEDKVELTQARKVAQNLEAQESKMFMKDSDEFEDADVDADYQSVASLEN